MKKKLLVLQIAAVLMAGNSFALSLSHDNLQSKSARLDALQLNVSVEDETNVIGLNMWGGNPAGLNLDETRSRVVPIME